jgi:hypothetical protein
VNAGTPARLYVGSDYSIQVQNKNGSVVYSAPQATERYSDPVISGIDSSEVTFLQAGTGAVVRTAQSKMRDVVSVKDFGAVGDGVADDTVAIQNALNAANYVFLPPGTYLFSTLTVRQNTRLQGASTRTSILKHTGAGAAITCTHSGATEPDGTAAYIESGWFIFEDFELQANGTFGFRVGNTRSSFTQWNRIYMRHLNDGGTYAAGTVAIDCDNTPWSSSESTYLSKIHHTFIRGFETAVNLQDVVNAWEINRLYTISCLKQVVLSNATGIGIIDSYFESGIAGAIGITFLAGGGNQINVIGTTFELTNVAATQYAYSFAGGTWETITVMGAKYLIQGDGNAVNARRITGTAPLSFVELGRTYTNVTLSQNLPMLWAPGAASNKPFQAPNFLRLGGVPGGDGRVILARGGSDASDGWIENDGAFGLDFVSPGSGSVVDFDWRGSDGTLHLRFQAYSGGTGKGFYPNVDNDIPLGGASKRWSEVYAAAPTINTSDGREKQDITSLDAAERRVAVALKSSIKKFRFKDAVTAKGDNARIHVGVIAQEVIAAFQAEGLDPMRYAIVCYDEWDAEIGADGNEIRSAGSRYGIRYEELLAFIISAP